MKYRAEIDGLRAVAVLPVILFHAGVGIFSGGYVGVDVFFVISGYLITTILINDVERGRFSLLDFYERRARRILPALFVVMAACLPLAWLWMLPDQTKDFAQSLVAVSLFASNVLFWNESNYFANAAEEKPLLHTWSLAVEEQYYLLFPLLLVFLWRYREERVFLVVCALALTSFLLTEWGWRNAPVANFFLSFSRAWELLAGSICAFVMRRHGLGSNNLLASTGLAAIVLAIFLFDEATPFPSYYTLLPVGGVALLILYADQRTLAARLLSHRAFVGVGLVSYSAYLWHQPLFAFARIYFLDPPAPAIMYALAALSLVLAYLGWRFVEQPFRRRHGLIKRRATVFILAGLGMATFTAIGVAGVLTDGFAKRHNFSKYELWEGFEKKDPKFRNALGCAPVDFDDFSALPCVFSPSGRPPQIAVIGDSHAAHVAIGLAARDIPFVTLGYNGCPPLLEVDVAEGYRRPGDCEALARAEFDYVRSNPGISQVMLVARWSLYTTGDYGDEMHRYFLVSDKSGARNMQASREVFREGLERTIRQYQDLGLEVIVMLQAPQQLHEPEEIVGVAGIKSWSKAQMAKVMTTPRRGHNALQAFNRGVIAQVAGELPGVRVVDPDPAFCNAVQCPMFVGNTVVYRDDDHLNQAGAERLADLLDQTLSLRQPMASPAQ